MESRQGGIGFKLGLHGDRGSIGCHCGIRRDRIGFIFGGNDKRGLPTHPSDEEHRRVGHRSPITVPPIEIQTAKNVDERLLLLRLLDELGNDAPDENLPAGQSYTWGKVVSVPGSKVDPSESNLKLHCDQGEASPDLAQ